MMEQPGRAAAAGSSCCSEESWWDAYLDNWTELYAEIENELPQMKIERRRMLAQTKLRLLIQKLDEDLNRTILQMSDEEMERFIAAEVEDAATGYLATARKLGKRVNATPEEDELKHTTERIQHIDRSKTMVGIFNKIVRSHDLQLYRAVHKLTQEQRDRIVRVNHEQFSGFHRQKRPGGSGNGSRYKSEKQPNRNLNHEFATPRVKSAAKSRKAVALLNSIVDAKDDLLKQAIVSMDRSARNHLISKNNDFVKFEEQRKKQREEFAMTRKTTTAAEHKFATERVKQVVRAKAASEVFEAILRSKGKRLAGMVKKIPKADKDGFLQQISGESKNVMQKLNTQAVTLCKKRNRGKKNVDAARYIRGEVMVLRRRVTEDVQNVIQEKDQELEKFVANMDQEQMERTLTDFVPSGMDDLSVWKRDRQKRAWKRLSAFGLVRDDPSLYQQWKQQRHHRARSDNPELGQACKIHEVLGSTCAADAARRPPWSADLHYVRPPSPRKLTATCKTVEGDLHKNASDRPQTAGGTRTPESDPSEVEEGETTNDSKTNIRSSSGRRVVIARARPVSAPPVQRGTISRRLIARGTALAPTPPEAPPPASSRSCSLARLARVFYQSSVASTMSGGHHMSETSRGARDHLHSQRGSTVQISQQSSSCLLATQVTPEFSPAIRHTYLRKGDQSAQEGISVDTEQLTNTSSSRSTEFHVGNRPAGSRRRRENINNSTTSTGRSRPEDGLETAEQRLEEVRLLLAASQLSAEAVTRNIMSGYFERKRAREPNRRKREKAHISSRVPQPPGAIKIRRGQYFDGRSRGRPNSLVKMEHSMVA